VQIPRWTRAATGDAAWPVGTWGCEYDARMRDANTIYLSLSCGEFPHWRMREKYQVDLNRSGAIRPLDSATWEAAPVLEPEKHLSDPERARFSANGMEYANHLFPKSGASWDLYAKALASPGRSRVAVFSFDGRVERTYDPTFGPQHFDGSYWTEIYDVPSWKRLIQIRGDFHGFDLTQFQGKSEWLGGRFFLQPLDVNGMRSLLICDVDQAAKIEGAAEVDGPPHFSRNRFSLTQNQQRTFAAETPQAHITGFHDEPVYDSRGKIEKVNVSVLLDVNIAGRYRLDLNVAGIQEMVASEVGVGAAQITVPITADRFRGLGLPGPYRIHSVQLRRVTADGQVEAEMRLSDELARAISVNGAIAHPERSIDASTQPYSLESLGSTLYFTGNNSAALIPASGSEEQRLEVQIGFHSEAAYCEGWGGLARTNPHAPAAINGSSTGRTLVLSFAGAGITQPAPYRLQQVGIRCGRDDIRSSELVVSPANASAK
jgi:hypothetical protein